METATTIPTENGPFQFSIATVLLIMAIGLVTTVFS